MTYKTISVEHIESLPEKPIDVSNVIYFNEAENIVSRIGYSTDGGKKFRVIKKNNTIIGK